MTTDLPAHHSGFIWLAIAGFAVFGLGMINQIVLRATFGARQWPLRGSLSNALLGVGAVLIVAGLALRG